MPTTIMSEESKPYIVSARKYRPATFRSVVGQPALTSTLKNAIETKRLAQAYLFCGPRGVGKTSCARIFAKTINCMSRTPDGEACGVCESCRAIDKGNSFNIVELDAASNNSVDDIRNINDQVNVPPGTGHYKVFIIDEVHMLSSSAFNAFLKTLEEPPKNVVFILATTEKHKVIPTILSRCQIYDFKRITIPDIVDHLEYVASEEGISVEREALGVIALKADGAMRDALSIFDQVAASSRGNITYSNTVENLNVLDYDYYFRIIDACREGDVAATLLIYKEIRDKGFDSLFFVNGLAAHVRDLMVAADSRTVSLLETSEEIASKYLEQAKTLPVQWYYAAIKLLNDCDFNYKAATGKRLLVELTLIRLCQLLKPLAPPFDSIDNKPPLRDADAGSSLIREVKPGHNVEASSAASEAVKSAPKVAVPAEGSKIEKVAKSQSKIASEPIPRYAASGKTVIRRPSTVRLSEVGSGSEPKIQSLEPRKTPVTPEAFLRAWNDFIARNPSLHILVNTMRGAKPVDIGDNVYRIEVDHPAQLQAFEMSMPKVLESLRESLSNDLLSLKVEVNTSPVENRQLPPKEFLRQVVEENPAMAQFLTSLNAELM